MAMAREMGAARWAATVTGVTLFMGGAAAVLVAALATGLVTGCAKSAKPGEADSGSAADRSALAGVTNEKDVKRFADEEKADEAVTLGVLATVRMEPPHGEPIVNLAPGTTAQKVAAHSEFLLVTFANPKTGDRNLGWIPASAIGSAPGTAAATTATPHGHVAAPAHDAGAHATPAVPVPVVAAADAGAAASGGTAVVSAKCSAGQALAVTPDGPRCMKTCATTADCGKDAFCTSGALADPAGHSAKLCFKTSN